MMFAVFERDYYPFIAGVGLCNCDTGLGCGGKKNSASLRIKKKNGSTYKPILFFFFFSFSKPQKTENKLQPV
jgi:hypothetical protein